MKKKLVFAAESKASYVSVLPLLARIKTEFILGNLTRIVRDFIENNHCQKISKNPQNPHMYIPNFIAGMNDFHKSVPQDSSNNF